MSDVTVRVAIARCGAIEVPPAQSGQGWNDGEAYCRRAPPCGSRLKIASEGFGAVCLSERVVTPEQHPSRQR
jgi:hypothetical protein